MPVETSNEQAQAIGDLLVERQGKIEDAEAAELALIENVNVQDREREVVIEQQREEQGRGRAERRKMMQDAGRKRHKDTERREAEVKKKAGPQLQRSVASWTGEAKAAMDGWQAVNAEHFGAVIAACRAQLAMIDQRREGYLEAFRQQIYELHAQRSGEDAAALQRHRDLLSVCEQRQQEVFGGAIAKHDLVLQAGFAGMIADADRNVNFVASRLAVIKNNAAGLLGSRLAAAAEVIDREAQQRRHQQLSGPWGEMPERSSAFEGIVEMLSFYPIELRFLMRDACEGYGRLCDDLTEALQQQIRAQRQLLADAIAVVMAQEETEAAVAEKAWLEELAGIKRKFDLELDVARETLRTEMDGLVEAEYMAWMTAKAELAELMPLELPVPIEAGQRF